MESALYEGWVWHKRLRPKVHAFRYPLLMAYLDLAELPHVFQGRWLWSAARWAPARFRREDHFGDPAEPLEVSVRKLVRERTGRNLTGPIRLLTNLSYWGYCFNPISIYYCFDASGRELAALVAEVTNTPWGERHCYVLDAQAAPAEEEPANERSPHGIAARFAKAFHVSPFMPMEQVYGMAASLPGGALSVEMDSRDGEGVIFQAGMALRRRPISARSLATALFRYPFMTGQVIAKIYWQALRLWIKGVTYVPHPT